MAKAISGSFIRARPRVGSDAIHGRLCRPLLQLSLVGVAQSRVCTRQQEPALGELHRQIDFGPDPAGPPEMQHRLLGLSACKLDPPARESGGGYECG